MDVRDPPTTKKLQWGQSQTRSRFELDISGTEAKKFTGWNTLLSPLLCYISSLSSSSSSSFVREIGSLVEQRVSLVPHINSPIKYFRCVRLLQIYFFSLTQQKFTIHLQLNRNKSLFTVVCLKTFFGWASSWGGNITKEKFSLFPFACRKYNKLIF
jgi:hypothetical protein